MANEILDGSDMVGQLFGRRQGFARQPGNTLPQGVVEAFNMIGFPGFLRNGSVPLRRNHTWVDFILICMEGSLFTVHQEDLGPRLFGAVSTAITHAKRNDLAACGIQGDPNPLPVGLLLHKAPHLIGFGFEPGYHPPEAGRVA